MYNTLTILIVKYILNVCVVNMCSVQECKCNFASKKLVLYLFTDNRWFHLDCLLNTSFRQWTTYSHGNS